MSPGRPYHPKGVGVGYLITVDEKTVYHVGDTDVIPEIKEIKNVDLMLIPIGGTNTLDIQEAIEVTLEINPKKTAPMHRGLSNPIMYKESVESSGDTEVIILNPCETLKF